MNLQTNAARNRLRRRIWDALDYQLQTLDDMEWDAAMPVDDIGNNKIRAAADRLVQDGYTSVKNLIDTSIDTVARTLGLTIDQLADAVKRVDCVSPDDMAGSIPTIWVNASPCVNEPTAYEVDLPFVFGNGLIARLPKDVSDKCLDALPLADQHRLDSINPDELAKKDNLGISLWQHTVMICVDGRGGIHCYLARDFE